MVTAKRLHCAWRPKMMIYSNNMIAWKRIYNFLTNPKQWSHLYMVRNYIKYSKYKNQQQ